jgi:hypothetical protein
LHETFPRNLKTKQPPALLRWVIWETQELWLYAQEEVAYEYPYRKRTNPIIKEKITSPYVHHATTARKKIHSQDLILILICL